MLLHLFEQILVNLKSWQAHCWSNYSTLGLNTALGSDSTCVTATLKRSHLGRTAEALDSKEYQNSLKSDKVDGGLTGLSARGL